MSFLREVFNKIKPIKSDTFQIQVCIFLSDLQFYFADLCLPYSLSNPSRRDSLCFLFFMQLSGAFGFTRIYVKMPLKGFFLFLCYNRPFVVKHISGKLKDMGGSIFMNS